MPNSILSLNFSIGNKVILDIIIGGIRIFLFTYQSFILVVLEFLHLLIILLY